MREIISDQLGDMPAGCKGVFSLLDMSLPILKKTLMPVSVLVFALASNFVRATEIEFSGFMSVVGGEVLKGSRTTPFNDVACPCVITDWNHFSTYNQNLSFNQESRAGVRMNAKFSETLSGVVQVDGRTQNHGSGSLEWAYVSYVPAEDWTVQLGRKRIPIYYYSDFMDVGFAYPWVRPSQELYGWEVNNFNALTIANSSRMGDWNARASVFYGREDSHDNVLSSYYYPGQHPDLTWRDIQGADLELTRDWLNIRFVYIESKVDINAATASLVDGAQQRIYGMAVNVDYDDWLIRSEFSLFDRWRDIGYRSDAASIGGGKHLGRYTPMLSYSYFKDENNYNYPNYYNDHWAVSVRYDLTASSAIKTQYDWMRELSQPGSTSGDAQLISFSFDQVF